MRRSQTPNGRARGNISKRIGLWLAFATAGWVAVYVSIRAIYRIVRSKDEQLNFDARLTTGPGHEKSRPTSSS